MDIPRSGEIDGDEVEALMKAVYGPSYESNTQAMR